MAAENIKLPDITEVLAAANEAELYSQYKQATIQSIINDIIKNLEEKK